MPKQHPIQKTKPFRKKCYCCKTDKPAEDFGKNKSKPDGLSTECRLCKRTMDVISYKNNRTKRLIMMKTYRENNYDRLRILGIEYSRSLKGRAFNNAATKKYYCAHKQEIKKRVKVRNIKYFDRYVCRSQFSNAIKLGYIARPTTCELCFIECTPDGHHTDYLKPFEVVWCCESCHGKMHRKEVMLNDRF